MQLIIISPNKTKHQHWHLSSTALIVLASMALLILSSLAYTAYKLFGDNQQTLPSTPITVSQSVTSQSSNTSTTNQSDTYYAKRLGQLQAEAIRLKALTDKLADMSGLDIKVAGLDTVPGLGGAEPAHQLTMTASDFESYFHDLENSFESQSEGLQQLQDYLIIEDNIKSAMPAGRPIKSGWVSSYYGYRADPFTGRKTFHHGLDFAGKEGSEVIAVADGIVTWQGAKGGYGEMIEIDHGNGYQTRYAHNKELTVKVGDKIKKGDTIALMGSTGRSTGPHVHFEILRDGKTVNPYNFIKK